MIHNTLAIMRTGCTQKQLDEVKKNFKIQFKMKKNGGKSKDFWAHHNDQNKNHRGRLDFIEGKHWPCILLEHPVRIVCAIDRVV